MIIKLVASKEKQGQENRDMTQGNGVIRSRHRPARHNYTCKEELRARTGISVVLLPGEGL